MQSLRDKVLVRIEKTHEDEVTYGNLTLQIDYLFKPEHYARIYGTVVGVSKTEDQLKVGDKVYFHYLVVGDSHAYADIFSISRERIFCYVRDGIHPLGYWALCLPHSDEKEDTVKVNNQDVKVILKSGLVVNVNPQPSAKKTRISKIGKNRLQLKNGEVVYADKGFEFENEIEGTTYYCVKHQDILGKTK